jgi:putative hydrolase of the HAD superfamily
MSNKAIMFDLDDTLLDRDKAVEVMFSVIVEKCYKNIDLTKIQYDDMLCKFKIYDNKGYERKNIVLNSLFDEFPPSFRISESEITNFWNCNFPKCTSIDTERVKIIKKLKEHVKTAIITNGSIKSQKGKIEYTKLDKLFKVILISEEVGVGKPDPKIFELALNKLDVLPKNALFVGDNLINDIGGCQNAGIRGIWFNPNHFKNDTDIKPFAEIHDFSEILDYINF